jgi:hypothetical protein
MASGREIGMNTDVTPRYQTLTRFALCKCK